MKRTFPISMCLAFAAFGIACGGKDKPEARSAQTTSSETVTTPNDQNAASNSAFTRDTHDATRGPAATSGGAMPQAGSTGSAHGNTMTGATSDTTATTTLSDDQVLHVMHLLNTSEVDAARLAQQKAKNARVKQFASMMIRDHSQANTKGMDVAKKGNFTMSESAISTTMQSDAQRMTDRLKGEAAGDFDRAYIDEQIKAHQTALDTIDTKLMPQAKNTDVRNLVQTIRPKIAAHLKEAQDIQASMTK